MKVTPRAADGFAARPDPRARIILVYGPDRGLVHERVTALVRAAVDDPGDPFSVGVLTAGTLASEPARLADEAAELSLTGGRRVVVVRDAGSDCAAAVRNALADAHEDNALIVVEAGDLPARAELRRLCEGAGNAAAIPCYADDSASLARLVTETLGARSIKVPAETRDYLVENLGSDRLLSRAELEKLALYVGDGGTATPDDAVACVGDSAQQVLEDACLAAADGDARGVDRALTRAWQAGAAPVALIRIAQRHFQRLHLVAEGIRRGAAADQAISSLRPPVFWKNRDRMKRHAAVWRTSRAATALGWLTEAEFAVKSRGAPDRALCGRVLLRIAHAARAARR